MFKEVKSLTLHIHVSGIVDVESIMQKLSIIDSKGDLIMSKADEILAAIAAEKEEVAAAVTSLTAQITALQEQVANGSAATPAQLEEIRVAVSEIFTSAPTIDPTPPTDPVA